MRPLQDSLTRRAAARSSSATSPSGQPLDGDKAGVGERSEFGVPGHHGTTVACKGSISPDDLAYGRRSATRMSADGAASGAMVASAPSVSIAA
mgnify:CR=1 FL=1